MNMKKYTADTMVNVMKKVRADLGDDAIILSSNVVQSKGILGLFKKKTVEVVAGYDAPKKSYEKIVEPPAQLTNQMDETAIQLKQEMAEMRKLLKNMQVPTAFSQYPDEMHPLLHHLKRQGLNEQLIGEIGDTIFNKMKDSKEDLTTDEQCEVVKKILSRKVEALPFGGITFQRKYINVLGPTGVGKTTTIAKIAARALLENKKKIGFITTDTYRIAAIEQLRTYANLLQAPVEVVYNQTDFTAAIDKFSNLDLVFIDTAGRNYKEAKYVEDLHQLVDFSLDMETFLVLSMTSKEEDMQMIVDQFKALPIEKFIFTKMDETSSMGTLFNLMIEYGYGTAYYTDGQEVPEDLEEATKQKVIQLLLEDLTHA